MKKAGRAPRAVQSSQRTTRIMASAKIAWRLRRSEATSSVIERHRTRRLWPPRGIDGTILPAMTNRPPDGAPRQRWQLLFSRTEPALRMRQADLVTELERAFREANLPLSYTRALKPRPRIKLAANLPVGLELRGEVVEAYFDDLVPVERIQAAGDLFPEGIGLLDAKEVWHGFPSAASQLRGAEYEIQVSGDDGLTSDALRG